MCVSFLRQQFSVDHSTTIKNNTKASSRHVERGQNLAGLQYNNDHWNKSEFLSIFFLNFLNDVFCPVLFSPQQPDLSLHNHIMRSQRDFWKTKAPIHFHVVKWVTILIPNVRIAPTWCSVIWLSPGIYRVRTVFIPRPKWLTLLLQQHFLARLRLLAIYYSSYYYDDQQSIFSNGVIIQSPRANLPVNFFYVFFSLSFHCWRDHYFTATRDVKSGKRECASTRLCHVPQPKIPRCQTQNDKADVIRLLRRSTFPAKFLRRFSPIW